MYQSVLSTNTWFVTVQYTVTSHALVSFVNEEEQPTCVLRTTRLKDCPKIQEGVECGVKWSDGNVYRAKVLAVGECRISLLSQSSAGVVQVLFKLLATCSCSDVHYLSCCS